MDTSFLDSISLEKIIEYGTPIVGAILVIIIGFWIANALARMVGKRLKKNGVDETITPFAQSMIGTGLKIMVLLAAIGMVGVDTASFVAIFAALSFALGFALQGTLAHFAAGVMLLFFRPYNVGDLVTIGGGQPGTVKELGVFNTVLATLDNKRVIVPNGTVGSNIITNISGQGIIGVELTYGIGYNDSIDAAREAILAVGKACPWIIEDPAQGVVVAEHGDSSVNLATRPFCKSEHYWDTFFYMQENVKKEFDKRGISIPFPQQDVHMHNVN